MRELHFDLLRLLEVERRARTPRARPVPCSGAGGGDAAGLGLPGPQGERVQGPARRRAGGAVAKAGTVRRHGQEPPGARALAGGEDRQAGHRPRTTASYGIGPRCATLNWNLVQLQRRGRGTGFNARLHGSVVPPGRAGSGSWGEGRVLEAVDRIGVSARVEKRPSTADEVMAYYRRTPESGNGRATPSWSASRLARTLAKRRSIAALRASGESRFADWRSMSAFRAPTSALS